MNTKEQARQRLLELLQEARAFLTRPDNDYAWSPWEGPEMALREVDEVISAMEAGGMPDHGLIRVWFVATGPIQEVSVSSGWGEEFIGLADRVDEALERLFPTAAGDGATEH